MAELRLSAPNASFLLTAEGDGSGDFLIAIEVEAEDFRGHADGHVANNDWHEFCAALALLESNRRGEAILKSAAGGKFLIRVGALNSLGHMSISGELSFCRSEWPRQRLTFAFEFDPSQLGAVQLFVQADR